MTRLRISKKNEKIFDPQGKNTDDAFEALRDPEVVNLKVIGCTVNGEKAVAIVAVLDRGVSPGLRPLFVSVTAGMELKNAVGEKPKTPDENVKRRKVLRAKGGDNGGD